MVEVVAELGISIIEAVDGPSGLEILKSDREINLLISDVGLPGLNGRQLADAGRALRPGLKVLFMTGYAETAITSDFLAHDMALVVKPFSIESLSSRIQGLLSS